MIAAVLAKQFHFTALTIVRNLEGMTEQQCLVAPPRGGACANWVLGHILAARNGVHRIVGIGPAVTEPLAERYGRGSAAVSGEDPGIPMAELLSLLETSRQGLAAALPGLGPEQLGAIVALPEPLGEGTAAEQLGLLLFHESYHAGQLAVFRRLAGLDGAIG